MNKYFHHLILITRHHNRVVSNGFHMGIFIHALKHDLSKLTPVEFITSSKYYVGNHSPVYEERLRNDYYSSVCQHHTRHNKHHWEYWTDFFGGRVLAKTMPWKYAVEYVCDVISASSTYNKNHFTREMPLNYFLNKKEHYFMSSATKEFVTWCLTQYKDSKWQNLKKKCTKLKYQEIINKYPLVDMYSTEVVPSPLPELKKK